jgi:hypothetical protein
MMRSAGNSAAALRRSSGDPLRLISRLGAIAILSFVVGTVVPGILAEDARNKYKLANRRPYRVQFLCELYLIGCVLGGSLRSVTYFAQDGNTFMLVHVSESNSQKIRSMGGNVGWDAERLQWSIYSFELFDDTHHHSLACYDYHV